MTCARLSRSRGLTVIELVVVVGLFGLVAGLLYRFLVTGSRAVTFGSEEVEGIRRANLAMERLKRDLRSLCDFTKVNDGASEVSADGRSIRFRKFLPDATRDAPAAVEVRYQATDVKATRGGREVTAVRLEGFYGESTHPVLSEDVFADVRFKRYWLNGKLFWQVRLGVPDLTGKTDQVHYLQTSVGSRYYNTLFTDPNWLDLDESKYVVQSGPPPR